MGLSFYTPSVDIPASALDTDPTAAANSDTKVMSQKAVREFVAANAGGGGVIGTAKFSITDNLGDPVIALDSATGIFAGATAGFSGGNFTVTYSASHPEAIVFVRSFDAPNTVSCSIHTDQQTDGQFVSLFYDGSSGVPVPLAHPLLTSVSFVAFSE